MGRRLILRLLCRIFCISVIVMTRCNPAVSGGVAAFILKNDKASAGLQRHVKKRWRVTVHDTVLNSYDGGKEMAGKTSCDTCSNYVYDEDYECYCCDVNLDEDEMYRFMSDTFYNCPYYQLNDEYRIVRKQM